MKIVILIKTAQGNKNGEHTEKKTLWLEQVYKDGYFDPCIPIYT